MTQTPQRRADSSPSMTSIRRRLEQVARVRTRWLLDGDWEPIDSGAIQDAHALALHCSVLPLEGPNILPIGDGSLQIECHREGANMEILLHGGEVTECFYLDLKNEVQISEDHADLRGAVEFLRKVQEAL